MLPLPMVRTSLSTADPANDPRANWFVAVPVAGEVISGLPAVPDRIRLYAQGDVHCTVAFFGAVGEEAARAGWDATLQALDASRPHGFDAEFAEVVPMGPPERYSALSALFGPGNDEATALIAGLRDEACRAAGARLDTRAVKPHVTLARPMRRATARDRDAGLAWAASLGSLARRVRLEHVALYTWSADRRERMFQVVASHSLEGGLGA
jgi:2'-5' RNA ligase